MARAKKNRPGHRRAGLPCETSRAPKAWPLQRASARPPILFLSRSSRSDPSKLFCLRSVTRPPSPVPHSCRKASLALRPASTLREGLDANRQEPVAQMQMDGICDAHREFCGHLFILVNQCLTRACERLRRHNPPLQNAPTEGQSELHYGENIARICCSSATTRRSRHTDCDPIEESQEKGGLPKPRHCDSPAITPI